MKSFLRIVLWLFIGIVIALLLLPFVFKDKVKEEIKILINDQVNAEVDFGDVDLSFIKAFPNASIEVNDIFIKGKEPFANINLAKINRVKLNVDIMSLFGDNTIGINSIVLDQPDLNIVVNKNGLANYDIMKDSKEANAPSQEITAQLDRYSINNGKLHYRDLVGHVDFDINDINHTGSGNFSNTLFDLKTDSKINQITLVQNGVTYLKNADLDALVNVKVDLNENKYTLSDNEIRLNKLPVNVSGFLQILADESYKMDFDFKSPNTNFEDIFSLIPYAYTKDYDKVTAKGSSSFEGKVKGLYNDKGSLPVIDMKIKAKDGYIKYPDFPQDISNINLDLHLNSERSDWEDFSIHLPEFSMNIANEPIKGKLMIEKAFGNFVADGYINGNVNLETFSMAFPIEDINKIKGIMDIDLEFLTSKSDIESSNYSNMKLAGVSTLKNVQLSYANYPQITIPDARLEASPQNSKLDVNQMKFGNSDFDIKSEIKNPLDILTENKTRGHIIMESNVLDYNQIVGLTEEGTEEVASTEIDSFSESVIKDLEFTYDVNIKDLKYEEYKVENVVSSGSASANEFTIDQGTLDFESSKIYVDGNFENIYDYTFSEEDLEGVMDIKAESIDLNKMYAAEESKSEEELETVILPKNIKMDINVDIGQIQYGTYNLDNIDGLVKMENGIANFKNVAMQALGGDLKLDGYYDSSLETQPEFSLAYNLSQVSFSQLYENSNSFKLLAPIAKFIEGKLNSTLEMKGPLGKDMMPILEKITANGFLETLNSKIDGFIPFEKLGDKLGISSLKSLSLENTKNWFTIEDGAVKLEPSSREFEGMKFNYSGKHYVDQNIDYTIKAEIPREKLKANVVSGAAEAGMSFLEKEAGKRGIDVNLGDMVYMDIKLTGSITNPKIQIIPTGSGGKSASNIVKDEITNQIDQIKDTLTREAEKKVELLKDTLTKKTNEVVDSAKKQVKIKINKKVDEVKEDAKEKVEDVIKSSSAGKAVDSIAAKAEDKVGEILGDKAKEEADKLKDKVKDFNPFKKKKKGN